MAVITRYAHKKALKKWLYINDTCYPQLFLFMQQDHI